MGTHLQGECPFAVELNMSNHKHGMKGTRIYRACRNMKDRCGNPNNAYYHRYGGRGIIYQDDWDDFEFFYNDMMDTYQDHLTLDRIDNDGDYTRENCRWSTTAEQAANKSNSITYNGETAHAAGIRINDNPSLVYQRLNAGWDTETAFTKPSRRPKT